jgi:hypothetical protein
VLIPTCVLRAYGPPRNTARFEKTAVRAGRGL